MRSRSFLFKSVLLVSVFFFYFVYQVLITEDFLQTLDRDLDVLTRPNEVSLSQIFRAVFFNYYLI